MEISDEELRAMIRDAIARATPGRAHAHASTDSAPAARLHPSHALLPLAAGDADGACVIEPAVRCTHCGYCLAYGH